MSALEIVVSAEIPAIPDRDNPRPADNPIYLEFLDGAEKAGMDREEVRQFFWLINASPNLSQFQVLSRRISEMLARATTIWPDVPREYGIALLPQLLEQLDAFTSSFKRFANVPPARTRHALHRALLESRAGISCADEYLLLQAHVFLSHIKVVRQYTSVIEYEQYGGADRWEALRIDPYHAGLALRDLAANEAWTSRLLGLLPVHLPPLEFARNLDVKTGWDPEKRAEKHLLYRLWYIEDFVREAHGLQKRGRGSGGHPGERATDLVFDNCPDEDNPEEQGRDDGEADESDPDEFEETQLRTFEEAVAQRRQRRIFREKAFLFGNQNLTPVELVPIEVRCRREAWDLLGKEIPTDTDLLAAEIRIALLMLLWTGGSEAQNYAAKIWLRPTADPSCDFAAVIDVKTGWLRFRRAAPLPVYKHVQRQVPGRDRIRQTHVVLPDEACLGSLTRRLCVVQERVLGSADSFLLFRTSSHELHCGISALLRSLDPSGRLTVSKIAKCLWTSIIAYTGGDVVAAAMLTGQDRMASKVAMFYACRNLLTGC